MKKLFGLLLVLALVLAFGTAFAAETDGQGGMVARNAELAAFMDGNGNIFISGQSSPINTTTAQSILSVDPYRILFFAKANTASGISEHRLVSLDLGSSTEAVITDDAYAACLEDDYIYYISAADRKQLMRYDINTKSAASVLTAPEDLERIYTTVNGVVTTLVEGAGAYIYDEASTSFVNYDSDIAAEIVAREGYDLYLTDSASLYMLPDNGAAAVLIDAGVQDWAVISDTVYYLTSVNSSLTLKSYNVTNALWSTILTPAANVQPQLTASENSLFMISDQTIYSVDVLDGKLATFASLPALKSYSLGNGKKLDSYRIEAVSGQLNVYGIVSDSNTLPTFTFVSYSSEIVADTSNATELLSAYAIDNEDTVWDLLQPAPQYSPLRRGSRGDAVSAIQKPLHELGYYDYYIDGIFGWRTERAIQLLQADLGLRVNGVADEALQKTILAGGLSAYDPYKALSRGDRGMRVTEMQQRLRDLGYLADDADSMFGPRTQKAVELFQQENNLNVNGSGDHNTLQRLFSSSATRCSSYIDLVQGDTGYRVRELNKRLKALYYLTGDVGSTYTKATAQAIRLFQAEAGLKQNGNATSAVQQRLFASSAPEYSGYITLKRGDENSRVTQLQKRLKDLGYFSGTTTGYYGRVTQDAVKQFQRAVGWPANGTADPDTLARLFAADAPAYKAPVKIGTPVIELSAYSKYENGIYYIADEVTTNGGVTVSWFADGDVGSYDIKISDDRGGLYTNDKNVSVDMTIASIPITSLDPERTYTVSITAHPQDEKADKATSASIKFVRVMETPDPDPDVVGTISSLVVTPTGDGIVYENGIYQMPGDTLNFNWNAVGSVAGYTYAFTTADGATTLKGNNATSNTTADSIAASDLASGNTYLLTVNAIPTNGTIADATVKTISFKLKPETEVSLPTPTPEVPVVLTEAPTTGTTPTPEETATTEATATAEVTGTPEVTATAEVTGTPEVTVTATAENTPEVLTSPTPVSAPVPEVLTTVEALPSIGTPALSVEPYSTTVEANVTDENGETATATVYLVSGDTVTFGWAAEGDVSGYNVQILDSANNVMTDQNLTNTGATVPASNLTPDMIYRLQVTAYSTVDSEATTTAQLYFELPAAAETEAPATEEPATEAPVTEAPVTEAPVTEAPVTEAPVTEAPVTEAPVTEAPVTEAPIVVGTPVLSVSPFADSTTADVSDSNGNTVSATVYLLSDGEVTLSWPAEGNLAGYSVRILDADGNIAIDQNMTNTSATINTSNMTPGVVYTLAVTAVSADDASVTAAAELYFELPAAAETEAPTEAPTEEPTEAPTEEPTEAPTEEPTEAPTPEPTEEPTPEPTEEPTPEPTEEPTPEPTEEPTPEPTEEPTPEPTEEPAPAAAYPTNDPTAWTEAINADSDPAAITVIQNRLIEWGWLDTDSDYKEGKLDATTQQAVIDFQNYLIENGATITAMDTTLEKPAIEPETLALLFNADATTYENPNA